MLVGIALRPFGQNGEVRVHVLSDYTKRFALGASVIIDGQALVIVRNRPVRGHRVLKFEGLDTRDAVAPLANSEIYVDATELQPLPQGTYYHYDLIGMAVSASDGSALGEVTEVVSTGANDVLVVNGDRGEILVPVITDVLKDVDTKARRISIELLPGMI